MKKALLKVLTLCLIICSALCVFTACDEGAVDFKINFVVDGEVYKTISTSGGEVIRIPENPTKNDYTFEGWYWDNGVWSRSFTANSLLDTPLSSDMSVYAKFEHNHKDGDWVLISEIPATEQAAGKRVYRCSVCGEEREEVIPQIIIDTSKAEIVSATGFTFDGNNGYISVPNTTEEYSFINHIQVSSKASWVISTDTYGMHTIVTKTIPLEAGDNVVYLFVTSGDGNNINLYTMTVRRRPIYTVTFNTDGGSSVNSQTVEEGSFATEPSAPTKAGYTFDGWDYDFSNPITGNIEIKAQWTPITYNITYVLNGGTNDESNPAVYNVESDTIILASPTKTDYTFNGWYSDSGFKTQVTKIQAGSYGNKTLYAKWGRYTLTTAKNYNNAGSVTSYNDTKFAAGESVTITAITNTGFTFIGWFNGEEKLTGELSYTFEMPDKDVTYTAKWQVRDELEVFNFTSTTTTCTITGIKDKTVTEIIVPDYVTAINEGAFKGCSSLQKITIPFVGAKAGVTSSNTYQYPFGYIFGTSSYTGSTAITQYYYGSSTSSTTNTTYYIPTSLKTVTVTGGNILYGAFRGCSSLTSITIGNSVTSIGDWAFSGCSSLTSITIGNSVMSIWNDAFSGCSSLTSITVDSGNTKYHSQGNCLIETASKTLILGCNNSIIPSDGSVTSIGNYAFERCSSLTSVTIPDSVTSIGNFAFRECSSLTSITIPNSVTSIGGYAFFYCRSLTSITIGNSVTSIGEGAFRNCTSLTSITIPESVTSIGNEACAYCSSLESVTVDSGNTKYHSQGNCLIETASKTLILGCNNSIIPSDGSVTSIGNSAFGGCRSLTSITIPDGVTSIGYDAFNYCSSLTSVTIGNSVTSIGNFAFYNCSSLTKVYYKGTATEWSGISKGLDNSPLTSATRYYYSETQPTGTGNYWHYDADGKIVIW